MKERDKAIELFFKMNDKILLSILSDSCSSSNSAQAAKQCTLIAVDEILEHLTMVDDDAAIVYWKSVKAQIENL